MPESGDKPASITLPLPADQILVFDFVTGRPAIWNGGMWWKSLHDR